MKPEAKNERMNKTFNERYTKEVPCFTLQDIFISGEVLVLAFLSDPSNLWLDIFCSRYGFFSFVLFLI